MTFLPLNSLCKHLNQHGMFEVCANFKISRAFYCDAGVDQQMWNSSARKDMNSLSFCSLLAGTSPCGEEEQEIQSRILTPTHVILRVIVTSKVSLEKYWMEIDHFTTQKEEIFLTVTKKGSTYFLFAGGHSRRLPEGVVVPLWWKGLIMFEGWESSTHKSWDIDPSSSSFLTLLLIELMWLTHISL